MNVWVTRPEDCQQKKYFKMETLNIQTIFANASVATTTQHYPKT